MSRRRRPNQNPNAAVVQPAAQAAAPQLPALSAPVVIDRSKAKVKHMRTLSLLGGVRTPAELTRHLPALIELMNDLVVGGVDDRPSVEFWALVAEVQRQLNGNQGN
jgi:hypothetical protein